MFINGGCGGGGNPSSYTSTDDALGYSKKNVKITLLDHKVLDYNRARKGLGYAYTVCVCSEICLYKIHILCAGTVIQY